MTLQEMFEFIDADLKVVTARFAGNVDLLARFIKKFPDDKNFATLESVLKSEVLTQEALSEAEAAAHTLKGVSGNLGFDNLSRLCGRLVEALRGGRTEVLFPLLKETKEEYDKILKAISRTD